LIATVTALDDSSALTKVLTRSITPDKERRFAPWQMSAMASVFDALARRKQTLEKVTGEDYHLVMVAMGREALRVLDDDKAPEAARVAAVRLLGAMPDEHSGAAVRRLTRLLFAQNSAAVQSAVLSALARRGDGETAAQL